MAAVVASSPENIKLASKDELSEGGVLGMDVNVDIDAEVEDDVEVRPVVEVEADVEVRPVVEVEAGLEVESVVVEVGRFLKENQTSFCFHSCLKT